MKELPRIETHYNVEVWVNPTTESLRHAECLCLHCEEMARCPKAKKLYEACKEGDLALAVTRCPDWNLRHDEIFKPPASE